MNPKDYVVFAGEVKPPKTDVFPDEVTICLDGTAIPDTIFTVGGWYKWDFEIPGLVKHESDEILMLLGGRHADPEHLGAQVELQIENDVLRFDCTSAVYIPAGAAHGNLNVKNLSYPLFAISCHSTSAFYTEAPAQATEAAGKYIKSFTDFAGFDPTGVPVPDVDPDTMTRLFYLDSARVPGAAYTESVWFNKVTPPFLPAHVHDALDELVCFVGSDPEHPEDLCGELNFWLEDQRIVCEKSCLIFAPAGMRHNPFAIPRMERPFLHFSGGNNSKYTR